MQTARHNKVSIIVVNWNGERLLHSCLSALYRQTHTDREIILVDNGSSDNSVSLVREHFPETRLVELVENRGFGGGKSAGLACAKGEFIALINNDTRAHERWLENLVQPMLLDPNVGFCASKLLIDGRPMINSAGACATTSGGRI
jgi:GT2 family glycosyltransferase